MSSRKEALASETNLGVEDRMVSWEIKERAIPFWEWLEAKLGNLQALCTAVTLFAAIRPKMIQIGVIRLLPD